MDTNMSDLYVAIKEDRKLLSELIDKLKNINRKLAKAERQYKEEFTKSVLILNVEGYKGKINGKEYDTEGIAWTASTQIARGLPKVAEKRQTRDILKGDKEAVMQKIYQVKMEINSAEKEMEAISRCE